MTDCPDGVVGHWGVARVCIEVSRSTELMWANERLTFVIEEKLRRGVAVIPRDVLNDAAQCKWWMWTVVVDVDPKWKREPTPNRRQ